MSNKEELSRDERLLRPQALDTRNFEISLYWQRSNYFLVLNTALAVGFFFGQGARLCRGARVSWCDCIVAVVSSESRQ